MCGLECREGMFDRKNSSAASKRVGTMKLRDAIRVLDAKVAVGGPTPDIIQAYKNLLVRTSIRLDEEMREHRATLNRLADALCVLG